MTTKKTQSLPSIKDTWTKPKWVGSKVGGGDGWGEGERWGVNGDSYT